MRQGNLGRQHSTLSARANDMVLNGCHGLASSYRSATKQRLPNGTLRHRAPGPKFRMARICSDHLTKRRAGTMTQSSGQHTSQAAGTPRAVTTEHLVPEGTGTERLDRYVADTLPDYPSKKSAYKAIKRGDIQVDAACVSPDLRVHPGQVIQILACQAPKQRVLQIPLTVVYEDAWLAVVIKPADIPVSGNYGRTVTRALPANLAPSAEPDAMPWPHPVHRLDGPTAGLLVVAKTRAAAADLGRQFETRAVRKQYYAAVAGYMSGEGTILEPLDGRPAETKFQVQNATRSTTYGWISALDLFPHTGRTHQLRRHLALLGHPIIGDTQYGQQPENARNSRLLLCATGIKLRHPNTSAELDLSITPPDKFAAWVQHEENAWNERLATDSPA